MEVTPKNDELEFANKILHDVVGMKITPDTKTVTMTPHSFIRCLNAAYYSAALGEDAGWKTMESAPREGFEQIEVATWSEDIDGEWTWKRDIVCWQAAEYCEKQQAKIDKTLEVGDMDSFLKIYDTEGRIVTRQGWFRSHEGADTENEIFPTYWRKLVDLPAPPVIGENK